MEEGVAQGIYTFSPEGSGTKVTWAFEFDTGFNPLLRILGKFMDGMVGKDFEKGLSKLKTILEAMPAESTHEEKPLNDTIPAAL